MSSLVSANYRELQTEEDIQHVAEACATAWQDPGIPARQYELSTRGEMDNYRNGVVCAPFQALLRTLRQLPERFVHSRPRLLDVGASSGYYAEVLRLASYDVRYTGFDFSPAFKAFAGRLYPDIDFDLGDARQLPYPDDRFGIVLSGGCVMHVREYEKVIREAMRVSGKYVILHRTPIYSERPTSFFVKEAYGISCLEIHFNERELLELFESIGLDLLYAVDVFWTADEGFGHRTYLLEKQRLPEPYASTKSV